MFTGNITYRFFSVIYLFVLVFAAPSAASAQTIEITSGYVELRSYNYELEDRFRAGQHRGVDVRTLDSEVRAVSAGTIRFIGDVAGNRVVTIAAKLANGEDVIFTYNGVSKVKGRVGDLVAAGDSFAMGDTLHIGAYDPGLRYRYFPIKIASKGALPARTEHDSVIGNAITSRLKQLIEGNIGRAHLPELRSKIDSSVSKAAIQVGHAIRQAPNKRRQTNKKYQTSSDHKTRSDHETSIVGSARKLSPALIGSKTTNPHNPYVVTRSIIGAGPRSNDNSRGEVARETRANQIRNDMSIAKNFRSSTGQESGVALRSLTPTDRFRKHKSKVDVNGLIQSTIARRASYRRSFPSEQILESDSISHGRSSAPAQLGKSAATYAKKRSETVVGDPRFFVGSRAVIRAKYPVSTLNEAIANPNTGAANEAINRDGGSDKPLSKPLHTTLFIWLMPITAILFLVFLILLRRRRKPRLDEKDQPVARLSYVIPKSRIRVNPKPNDMPIEEECEPLEPVEITDHDKSGIGFRSTSTPES